MLAIKLQRVGRKHQPGYRLVVAEKRSKLNGPPVEDLGAYSTFTKQGTLNKERIAHWLKVGAQPTVTAHNLLVKEGILNAPKMKLVFKVPAKQEAPAASAVIPASARSDSPDVGEPESTTPAEEKSAQETPSEPVVTETAKSEEKPAEPAA